MTENTVKTVLELDLASYSDIARVLEENLDVYAVKAFEDQVQSFVDSGLSVVGLQREDVVLGTAGDNAILVFDDAAVMHHFADAVQNKVVVHNAQRTVESAKRWFRMGAATGPILLLEAERRIVGATVARAVRLEAAAGNGQILVDAATYDLLPDDLQDLYGPEEEIKGKRDERFRARRCTLVPMNAPAASTRSAKPPWMWIGAAVVVLLCAAIAYVMSNGGEKRPGSGPVTGGDQNSAAMDRSPSLNTDRAKPDHEHRVRDRERVRRLPVDPEPADGDRALAEWAMSLGAEIEVTLPGAAESTAVPAGTELPSGPFRLTNVDFRRANRPITDAVLAKLPGSNVEDLNLKETAITDAGLNTIADLPLLGMTLKGVRGMTDVGAGRIGRIRSLTYLDLSHTSISDVALEHLKQLTNLRELNVTGTRVTREGIQRLQSAFAERGQRCLIEHD